MRNGLESSAIIYHACGHTIIVVPSTSTALSSKLSERQSRYIRTTHQPNTHRSVDLCICPVETGPGPWRWSLSASPRAVSRRLVCPRPGIAARIVSQHSPELKLNFSATLRIPSAWEVAVVYCIAAIAHLRRSSREPSHIHPCQTSAIVVDMEKW